MEKGFRVLGRVLSPEGVPVPGAIVMAKNVQYIADKDGKYPAQNSNAFDKHSILYRASNNKPYIIIAYDPSDSRNVDISEYFGGEPGVNKEIDLRMIRGAKIKGIIDVNYINNNPNTEVVLKPTLSNRYIQASTKINKDGTFEFQTIAPGTYMISLQPQTTYWDTGITVEANEEVYIDYSKGGRTPMLERQISSKWRRNV